MSWQAEELFLQNYVREQKLDLLRKATSLAFQGIDVNFTVSRHNMFLYDRYEVHEAYNSLNSNLDNQIRVVKTDLIYAIVDRVMRSGLHVWGPVSHKIKLDIVHWLRYNTGFVKYHIHFTKWIPKMYEELKQICNK